MDGNKALLFDGHHLDFIDGTHFSFHDPTLPFNADKDEIEFSPDIKEICFKFFDTVLCSHSVNINMIHYKCQESCLKFSRIP